MRYTKQRQSGAVVLARFFQEDEGHGKRTCCQREYPFVELLGAFLLGLNQRPPF